MQSIKKYIVVAFLFVGVLACQKESDLLIKRVASPVVIETAVVDTELTATITELDKSGILNKDVGIISTPVSGLLVEAFSKGVSKGTFTTDTEGKIVVPYAGEKQNEFEFTGTYKGVAFRIKK